MNSRDTPIDYLLNLTYRFTRNIQTNTTNTTGLDSRTRRKVSTRGSEKSSELQEGHRVGFRTKFLVRTQKERECRV